MKALSIKKQWVDLILSGEKTVEIRSWKPRKNPGIFAIHQSGKDAGIVATAEIGAILNYWECKKKHPSQKEIIKGCEGLYFYELKNVKPVKKIPIKGKLFFWEVPEQFTAQLLK